VLEAVEVPVEVEDEVSAGGVDCVLEDEEVFKGGDEVEVSVGGVELEVVEAFGSTTCTVRVAVPVRPEVSVTLYIIVWSPAAEVSICTASRVVVAPPSTEALMPRFKSA
jgi:hypothetical protein